LIRIFHATGAAPDTGGPNTSLSPDFGARFG
jgi:hypothetical protein